MSSAQHTTSSPSFVHRGISTSRSSSGTGRSEWWRRAPAAPAASAASGGSHPVRAPASTASTCCASTGIRTSCATSARSGAAGAIAIEAPVFSPTSAHILANATAFRPSASGYAFRFTRMTGVRIASPGAEPPRAYLKGAGSCGRRAGLVVLPPAPPPHDHEENRDGEDRDHENPRERVQRDPRRPARGGDDLPRSGQGLWTVHRHEHEARWLRGVPGPAREPVRRAALGDRVLDARGDLAPIRVPARALGRPVRADDREEVLRPPRGGGGPRTVHREARGGGRGGGVPGPAREEVPGPGPARHLVRDRERRDVGGVVPSAPGGRAPRRADREEELPLEVRLERSGRDGRDRVVPRQAAAPRAERVPLPRHRAGLRALPGEDVRAAL